MSCLIKHEHVDVKQQSRVDFDIWVSCRQCACSSSCLDIDPLWSGSACSAALQPRQGRPHALSLCCCRWTSSSGDCVYWCTSSDQSPTWPRRLADITAPISIHTEDRSVTFVWPGPGGMAPRILAGP